MNKANLFVKSTSLCSKCSSLWYDSLMTKTLMLSMKARIVCSYCSAVFKFSSIYFLRHSMVLRAFRRNQFTASIFRDFCCNFFCGPFAHDPLRFLHWGAFKAENCDLNSCEKCDNDCDSSCCDECDDCDTSWNSNSCRIFRFLKSFQNELERKITITRSCSWKSEQCSQCSRKQSNWFFLTVIQASSTAIIW